MRQLIRIEQNHINNGKLRVSHMCPAALAVTEQTDFDYCLVGKNLIALMVSSARGLGYQRKDSKVSKVLYTFIRDFDAGEPVVPINFYLQYD